jgi:hypothetical protein
MPVSHHDIAHAAHLCIQQHGDQATAHARSMVEEMRRKGDADGERSSSSIYRTGALRAASEFSECAC